MRYGLSGWRVQLAVLLTRPASCDDPIDGLREEEDVSLVVSTLALKGSPFFFMEGLFEGRGDVGY